MKKGLSGILALLVLVLGAVNVRLLARIRYLEAERGPRDPKVRLEPRSTVSSAPAEAPGAISGPAFSAPGRIPPSSAEKPNDPHVGTPAVGVPADGIPGAVARPAKAVLLSLAGTRSAIWVNSLDQELGLSEAQKRAIDELRKNRDNQTQGYRDMIDRIEKDAEDGIRRILDPAQLAKYDAMRGMTVNVAIPVPAQSPDPTSTAGPRPGFMGISGSDAQGGGVEVGQVFANSAASGSGLAAGDVILELNGQPIANYADLASKIQATDEGTPVNLKIRRGGSEFYQGLQLGSRQK